MVDQDASFYLMVVVAMSDQEIHEKEAKEIKEIADKFKTKFDPYLAAQEISEKFGNYFNRACDYYISIIQNTEVQKDTLEFIKKVTYADAKIHDKEIEIIEKCRKKWGIN